MAPAMTGPLSPSQEEAYRIKCIELITRMKEIASENDQLRLRKTRLTRGIKKMRMERAVLLDAIKQRMPKDEADADEDDETEDSSDSPPTPQERPLRTKKSHRRIPTSPPPAAAASSRTKDSAAGDGGAAGDEGRASEQAPDSQPAPAAAAAGRAPGEDAITLAASDAAVKADPETPAHGSKSRAGREAAAEAKGKEAGHGSGSEAFQAFQHYLLHEVLPTDPHGEAEVKNEFGNDYDDYARKKWGQLGEGEKARWEKKTKRGRSASGRGHEDVEMKDVGY